MLNAQLLTLFKNVSFKFVFQIQEGSTTADGGEVMSVMTVDNDGICGGLSEDILAQVVNKLLTEGQLDGGTGQTIIIRQEGAQDIQVSFEFQVFKFNNMIK